MPRRSGKSGPDGPPSGPARPRERGIRPSTDVSRGELMFSHVKDLQFEAKPDAPNAEFARRLQEILGGKWGELTVANQYLFQGWSCRLPGKYKDLLLDVGTEEMGHVEMICTMIARLLEAAPLSQQEAAAADNPMLAAIYSGQLPAHYIHAGGGPLPVDSNGVPWNGS